MKKDNTGSGITREQFLKMISSGVFVCMGFAPNYQLTKDFSGSIIPHPKVVNRTSEKFNLDKNTKISCPEDLKFRGKQLANLIEPATGNPAQLTGRNTKEKNVVNLSLDKRLQDLGNEGYKLSINGESIDISAYSDAGVYYGMQSLRQLLPDDIESKNTVNTDWEIGGMSITDAPRFNWRGLMIDCSRTFWDKEYLKSIMDLMALYKMNVLHLHLTDDQGWRVEIKQYPELTQKGARFPEKYKESQDKDGYYTQEDIKELVAYGQDRNITIVPEIEMPGHSLAVLACYPELACIGMGDLFEIHTFFEGPPIHEEILCAGYDKVFVFLRNVLTEVMELFPSEYIHIGGDEAPKTAWKQCPRCQARIKNKGLKNEKELQSWFIKQIGKFINRHDRKMIGWDEILQGGLAPNASVMSWRGMEGGKIAAQQKHYAVMSPTSHCYFDYSYENISTIKAYHFEPVPEELTASRQKYILGPQANFWSHIDRTEDKVDGQLFPRLLSISEVGWSPKESRDVKVFSKNVRDHLSRLSKLGVNYYEDATVLKDTSTKRRGWPGR